MTSLKPLPWSAAGRPWKEASWYRSAAAAALQSASAVLAQLAAQLALPVVGARQQPPMLEFYAEAGAPEGALYLDGELVGWLPGVRRL